MFVLKASWRYQCKTSWRCLEKVLNMPSKRFKGLLKKCWRRLARPVEDISKTYSTKTNILGLILNESNRKLRQAIIKIRISTNKFPIETGRFENKNQMDRICPFCCEDSRNEHYYLIGCKNKAAWKTRYEFLKPFYNRWEGIQ